MTCPSQLTRAHYADDALAPDAAAEVAAHLTGCARCREAVANLVAENEALSRALKTADADGVIPAFVPRPALGPLVSWVTCFALTAWAVNVGWAELAATVSLPSWLDWLVPDVGRLDLETMLLLAVRLVTGGGDGLAALLEVARFIAVLGAVVVAVWLLAGRTGAASRSLCLTMALSLTLLAAAPLGHAFELRRDEDRVTVPATEIVDDTLFVSAERILIEGTVTGDLIVAGEEVVVRGAVGGTLMAFAETVTVESEVGGNVVTAGETLDFSGALIRGNLYGAGEELTLSGDSRIGGSAALGVGEANLQGEIGRDLWTGTRRATLTGSVLGSIRAYAETVELTETARVGGDLFTRVAGNDNLIVADGAEIGGETTLDTWPEPENPYLTGEFYLGIVLRIVAALLAGLALFHLFPSLAAVGIDDAMGALTAAGIGAVALVATPILALVATATLIGAPIGLSTLLLYLIALYVAGLVTANQIGRLVPNGETRGRTLPLLAGLVALFVLMNLPVVGGVFRLAAVIIGLGLLLLWLRGLWLARDG